MSKKITIACIIAMLCFSFSYANYTSITSLQEIADELRNSDPNTLVVFDVDEVIITTQDHFMHPYADHISFPLIKKALAHVKTAEEKQDLEEKLSIIMLQTKRTLIEEETPKLIKDLKDKNIKVIALTSCPTGMFGLIAKVERWRIDHLKSLNIDFATTFPTINRQFLTEIAVPGKTAPLYEEGILFSKGYKKGEVLTAFLKECNLSPSKVIFIDDLEENLESVVTALEDINIECEGYHYTGARRFFKPEANEAMLHYQFSHLLNNREWLSDIEVAKRLEATCVLKS